MNEGKITISSYVFIIVILISIFGFDLGTYLSVFLGFIGFGVSYFLQGRVNRK